MRLRAVLSSIFVVCLCCAGARAQGAMQGPAEEVRPSEPRVALDAQTSAYDIAGRVALTGRLRTTSLAGTVDAPERNVRLIIENRSAVFYTYAAGWATFYGADNVRCGEGLWKLEALAPGESAEVDTPGLRLTCTPTTWRIVASNLITRTTDVAKPANENAPPAPEQTTPTTSTPPAAAESTSVAVTPALPPLEINVNVKTVPIQPGNPLEIVVGRERVRIIVQPVP